MTPRCFVGRLSDEMQRRTGISDYVLLAIVGLVIAYGIWNIVGR